MSLPITISAYPSFLPRWNQECDLIVSKLPSHRLRFWRLPVSECYSAPMSLWRETPSRPRLETVIPRQFANWSVVPEISPVKPEDPEAYVQQIRLPTRLIRKKWDGVYTDGRGNIVMLMVAYGPVQNYRLKAHRPEICYTAAGFRVSSKTDAAISYRDDASPIRAVRLVTQRKSRFEPVSYWMRVGNDISNGAVDNQLSRLKYGLKGIIPDGALFRVSTIGLHNRGLLQTARSIHSRSAGRDPAAGSEILHWQLLTAASLFRLSARSRAMRTGLCLVLLWPFWRSQLQLKMQAKRCWRMRSTSIGRQYRAGLATGFISEAAFSLRRRTSSAEPG